MIILALDPGPTKTGWVIYDSDGKRINSHDDESNKDVARKVSRAMAICDVVACEMVAGYGRPVGAEVFETAVWIGRYWQACALPFRRVYRREVKRHLCGSENKVNDAVIRQRLIDLFGPGKDKAIGTKKNPGPLYGLHGDEWAALAVAVTYAETLEGETP